MTADVRQRGMFCGYSKFVSLVSGLVASVSWPELVFFSGGRMVGERTRSAAADLVEHGNDSFVS